MQCLFLQKEMAACAFLRLAALLHFLSLCCLDGEGSWASSGDHGSSLCSHLGPGPAACGREQCYVSGLCACFLGPCLLRIIEHLSDCSTTKVWFGEALHKLLNQFIFKQKLG